MPPAAMPRADRQRLHVNFPRMAAGLRARTWPGAVGVLPAHTPLDEPIQVSVDHGAHRARGRAAAEQAPAGDRLWHGIRQPGVPQARVARHGHRSHRKHRALYAKALRSRTTCCTPAATRRAPSARCMACSNRAAAPSSPTSTLARRRCGPCTASAVSPPKRMWPCGRRRRQSLPRPAPGDPGARRAIQRPTCSRWQRIA